MAVKSKKTLFLQEAWKKAYRDGGAELVFDDPKHKQRVRMMLYNAVKAGKAGIDDDAEVNRAAQEIEIVEGPDPRKLYMRKVSDNPGMTAVANLLGHSMEQTREVDIEDSLRKLAEMGVPGAVGVPVAAHEGPAALPEVEGLKLEHKVNPFYAKRS